VYAMPVYPKRVALLTPGQNCAGADRPRPFSARFSVTLLCWHLTSIVRTLLHVTTANSAEETAEHLI